MYGISRATLSPIQVRSGDPRESERSSGLLCFRTLLSTNFSNKILARMRIKVRVLNRYSRFFGKSVRLHFKTLKYIDNKPYFESLVNIFEFLSLFQSINHHAISVHSRSTCTHRMGMMLGNQSSGNASSGDAAYAVYRHKMRLEK